MNRAKTFVRQSLREGRVRRALSRDPVAGAERRILSQNGEDGVILEILFRIGWSRRFFVEFGASDGLECNSAALALGFEWHGVLIEGDPATYDKLCATYASRPAVTCVQSYVSRDNIVELFERSAVPDEFDVLSIDIDGNDYWVWQALSAYRPRLVVIEYNAFYEPPKRWVMAYNAKHRWPGTTYFGASLASLHALGAGLGYDLVGTESAGINAFFVRRDLLPGSGLRARTPEEVYHRNVRIPFLTLPHGDGPFESI